eukprot:m.27448 g.27448  ORF g.27448 m.27448 type:complete len:158 (-) comp9352_c0_seq2:307-780(-)
MLNICTIMRPKETKATRTCKRTLLSVHAVGTAVGGKDSGDPKHKDETNEGDDEDDALFAIVDEVDNKFDDKFDEGAESDAVASVGEDGWDDVLFAGAINDGDDNADEEECAGCPGLLCPRRKTARFRGNGGIQPNCYWNVPLVVFLVVANFNPINNL